MTPPSPSPRERIHTLDALRGLAALAVCLFHFGACTESPSWQDGLLRDVAKYGRLGVEAFFVLSGFVIPYALVTARYEVRDYGRFLFKRGLRLEPPYLVCILLILVLAYLSTQIPGYRGDPFALEPVNVLLHLGYMNAVFGQPWLNPVFWTLVVEFQYYLFVGLAFPLLCGGSRIRRFVAYGVLAGVSLVPAPELLVTRFFPLFLMGVATLQYRLREVSVLPYLAAIFALACASAISLAPVLERTNHGPFETGVPFAVAGAATALGIAFVRINWSPLNWLGMVSYSLYLTHVPIGGRVENLIGRVTDNYSAHLAGVLVSLAVSVAFAYVYYRLVEKPSTRWASAVRYRRPVSPPLGA